MFTRYIGIPYVGLKAGTVQSTAASFVGREHDPGKGERRLTRTEHVIKGNIPSSPKKKLAPSVPSEEFEDGVLRRRFSKQNTHE